MLASDIHPDNLAWTTYISGLMQCRDWRGGLQAIEDMGHAWKRFTAQKVSNLTIKPDADPAEYAPSMVPINGAISIVLNLKRPELVESILSWAKGHSLSPNLETFNSLLRTAVRSSDQPAVQRALSDMKAHGYSPDIITFTTLLDGYLRNTVKKLGTESPEEQEAAISRIFTDMDAAGIAANPHTYSTIVHSLLSSAPPSVSAARAVLARMAQKNLQPTPHVCTILVRHYFASDPPDLAAVEGLWRRIRADKINVDHVFYDRIIEGYAQLGEMEKMLNFLRLMPAEGKIPGWVALAQALRTLVTREEWDLCSDLVEDVEGDGGLLRLGKRGWRGEDEFWMLVAELRSRGLIGGSARRAEDHKE